MASHSKKPQGSIHEFTVKDARGNDVDLSTYKGKALLIVNVASQCGLTNSNYTELNQLYDKYKHQDFEILAFPCNQFGSQEPGNNEQILEVACTRFKAEFPIFDKMIFMVRPMILMVRMSFASRMLVARYLITATVAVTASVITITIRVVTAVTAYVAAIVDVNGDNATPVYKFLKASKGGLFGDSIKWNFSKFLVDKDGHVVDRYAPTTSPLSIEKDLKKLLGAS